MWLRRHVTENEPSRVFLQLIAVGGSIRIPVMVELCQSSRCVWDAVRIGPRLYGVSFQTDC